LHVLLAAFVAYVVVQPNVTFALMMRNGKLAIAGVQRIVGYSRDILSFKLRESE